MNDEDLLEEEERCYQYRVWDVEQAHFLDFNFFLGPDGYLYQEEFDESVSLLMPAWFDNMWGEKYRSSSSIDYARLGKEREKEIKQHQHEWYIIELATGEQDSKEHLIFEGDIIYAETWTINHMGNKVLSYLTYIEVRFPRFWCDVLEWLSGESYTILGNIHENPDLLEKVKAAR